MTRNNLIPVWIPAVAFMLCAATDARAVDYAKDVAPILERHCIECHGPDEQESNLRVDRRVNMLRGGDSGLAAVVPGKPESSYLIEVVKHLDADVKMPPDEDKIPANEIELLEQWIKAGAVWPGQMEAIVEERPNHWSFRRSGEQMSPS